MNTNSTYSVLKRVVDVIGATLALVVLSPVFVTVAALVRLTSGCPIFFVQERVGRGGRPFRLLKFRSMVPNRPGLEVTASDDTRITPIGRYLRRYKLDELPQLFNVLKGDMSFVGPRPEVRHYVELFAADYARILCVRPGLTDFAAIEFCDEESLLATAPDPERAYVESILPAKIVLYDRYLQRMSLTTDLSILTRTLVALIK